MVGCNIGGEVLKQADGDFCFIDNESAGPLATHTDGFSATSSNDKSPLLFDKEESKWHAVLARDPFADGTFVYLVKTTKIYCRPTCPSRRPLRHNVSFEDCPAAAAQRGYKPCKRCLPNDSASASQHRQSQAVDEAQAVLMSTVLGDQRVPKLEELAAQVGMSKFHFQRVFKKSTGMSPAEYARSLKTGASSLSMRADDSDERRECVAGV